MAQWRKWHSDASTSKAIWLNTHNPLSPMLFPYIVAHMDDDGRMEYHPASTLAVVCPLGGKSGITPETFDAAVNDLCAAGLLIRYSSGNQEFLSAIPAKWQERQPVRKDRHKPSSHPAPPLGNQVATKWQPTGNRDNDTDHDHDTDDDKTRPERDDLLEDLEKASLSLGNDNGSDIPSPKPKPELINPTDDTPVARWLKYRGIHFTSSDRTLIEYLWENYGYTETNLAIIQAIKNKARSAKYVEKILSDEKREQGETFIFLPPKDKRR